MPRRATLAVPISTPEQAGRFLGIDRRNLQTGSNPNSLFDAINCDLTIGGNLKRRDGLILHAKLPVGTIGLYSIAGKLRVAAPSGHSLSLQMPAEITLDEFGDSATTITPLNQYVRVSDVTSWDSDPTHGAQPYLVLETSAGQYLHHWINKRPTSFSTPIFTGIQLGFDSGPDVEKLQGKLWSIDKFGGTVHFSSTLLGPGVWREVDAPGDAGFISPLEHADSDPLIKGIKRHQGKLMVVYDNAIQIWKVDPDPALHGFLTSLRGPGTKVFESFQPVIGDVFYFSDGGFRSLVTQTVTGELRQGDLGSPIEPITRGFRTTPNGRVRALWSQARSQYICMFTDTVTSKSTAFVYTHVPSFGIGGWTQWDLPLAADYLVEHEEELFIRQGDRVYKFDPTHCWDDINDVRLDVESDVITQFLTAGKPRQSKQWTTMDVTQTGKCDISLLPDQRDRKIELEVAFDLDGSTHDIGQIPVNSFGHSIALRFKAKLLWELDGFALDVMLLDGVS